MLGIKICNIQVQFFDNVFSRMPSCRMSVVFKNNLHVCGLLLSNGELLLFQKRQTNRLVYVCLGFTDGRTVAVEDDNNM